MSKKKHTAIYWSSEVYLMGAEPNKVLWGTNPFGQFVLSVKIEIHM